MIRLAIGGCRGRTGQRVVALAQNDPRFNLAALYDSDTPLTDQPFDVMIDFSTPAGTMTLLEHCLRFRRPLVTGVTGHTPDQLRRIHEAADEIPVLHSPNFSIGINVLLEVAPLLARRLSDDFDIEIVETHHAGKVDAPSGTALSLLDAIIQATGRNKQTDVVHGREGQIGPKDKKQIAVHAVRTGDVVGSHQIIFGGSGESITLSHEARSRDIFAHGALKAAAWITHQPPGLYSMRNVITHA